MIEITLKIDFKKNLKIYLCWYKKLKGQLLEKKTKISLQDGANNQISSKGNKT